MIKLIVADLDGTLLNEKKELPWNMDRFMLELKKRQIRFVPASGRQGATLRNIFAPWDDGMAYISENGNVVSVDDKVLYYGAIEKNSIEGILNEIDHVDNLWPALDGVKTCFIQEGHPFEEKVRHFFNNTVVLKDLREAIELEPICKIACADGIDAETNSYPILKHLKSNYDVVLSGDNWLDISKMGENKGKALSILMDALHYDRSEVMVFGDYLNDLEMMHACDNSWAMKNGHDDLKKAAAFVTEKSNDENGVVETVLSVLDLKIE